MKLLFLSKSDKMMEWRKALKREIPNLQFCLWPDEVEPKNEIDYALVWNPPVGELRKFINLKAILSLGAGVDGVLCDPELPKTIPIIRLVDSNLTKGMTEYIVYWTLFHHRKMGDYANIASNQSWGTYPQQISSEKKIGILGAGELGIDAANALRFFGFDVATWSTSSIKKSTFQHYKGLSGLPKILQRSDILICLLPLTKDTIGILNASLFSQMPKGSILINCARGKHLVEADLISALKSKHIQAATLDVFNEEPLPITHPFWQYKNIFITPHMASLTNPTSASKQIAQSIQIIESGQKPLNSINMTKGY